MLHLTLQEVEVVDRVTNCSSAQEPGTARYPFDRPLHHPDFYVPRVTRFFAGLLLGAFRGGESGAKGKRQQSASS